MNPIIPGIRFVVDNSKYVTINMHKLDEFVSGFEYNKIKSWKEVMPFKIPVLTDSEKIASIIIIDSLNFCYWGTPKWTINYENKSMGGAFGLIGSIYRALEENIPILDPKYLENMTADELRHIFRGNTTIPLFDERLRILNEIGKNINRKYEGNFMKLVEGSERDVFKLLNNIVNTFPSYKDVSIYKGREIPFYKRAQLAIIDIHDEFDGKGPGEFHNIKELTAFAEYKIPQILRKLGILQYDAILSQKIDTGRELLKDSIEEVEIRANMVWAIELMKNKLKKKYPEITSANIDNYLWILSQDKSPDDKPYHHTRTIAY